MNSHEKLMAGRLLGEMEKRAGVPVPIVTGMYGGMKYNPEARAKSPLGGFGRGLARGALTVGGMGVGAGLGNAVHDSPWARIIGALGGGVLGHLGGRRLVGEYGYQEEEE